MDCTVKRYGSGIPEFRESGVNSLLGFTQSNAENHLIFDSDHERKTIRRIKEKCKLVANERAY